MKRKTHRRAAKILFPHLDPKIIELIDKLIDTPKPWMPPYSPELGQVPGLSHRGHRKFGHDLITAASIGIQEGGTEGLAAALAHLLLDAGRDQIVKVSGEDGADLVEAAFNIGYNKLKKRGGKRKILARNNNRSFSERKRKEIKIEDKQALTLLKIG